jgi:hypothetical protein
MYSFSFDFPYWSFKSSLSLFANSFMRHSVPNLPPRILFSGLVFRVLGFSFATKEFGVRATASVPLTSVVFPRFLLSFACCSSSLRGFLCRAQVRLGRVPFHSDRAARDPVPLFSIFHRHAQPRCSFSAQVFSCPGRRSAAWVWLRFLGRFRCRRVSVVAG